MANEVRLIDANEAIRKLRQRREDFANAWLSNKAMPENAKAIYAENLECALIVADVPTVDAEPVKHGRWEVQSDGYSDDYWKCSACSEEWFFIEDPATEYARVNYCPNCGAKMDKEN